MTFNENSRVKIPALIHLGKLGYKYLPLKEVLFDSKNNIATEIFAESLHRLNPGITEGDIARYYQKISRVLDDIDLGKQFFEILRGSDDVKIFDFEKLENNSYYCVTELEYKKGLDSFRPDITILVNGLPLSFIEVKKPNNKDGVLAEKARIDTRMRNANFRNFINVTQLMIFSNNMEYDEDTPQAIQGAFYATPAKSDVLFNRFREEQTEIYEDIPDLKDGLDEEFILRDNNLLSIKSSPEFKTNCDPKSPTNRVLTSLLLPSRLAFILKYGVAYVEGRNGLEKHIMRYPQFFGARAVEKEIQEGKKRGIIWHTQGSGKTALSYFISRRLTDYFQDQNRVAKFYFIVDRIDLMRQARSEFSARGLHVNLANTKQEFLEDFVRPQAISNRNGRPEITVVNIQKFADEAEGAFKNEYDLDIQRIYFIDEAHRSYRPRGSFLANLISSDRNAILICLTGTPLIGDHASKIVFGDYFHRYYYNRSIADGYTLRLLRENIDTSYASQLKKAMADIEIARGSISKAKVLAHPRFVRPMLNYIVQDLRNFRIGHADQTVGGMVVCDSSDQAREMFAQYQSDRDLQTSLTCGLVLHDEGTKEFRDELVDDFKAGRIDLLFVYNMLLTGFDSPRLKKLYLGRVVRQHNLLQALTRVNRPYNEFRFGHVVDFADITEEFKITNAAYYAELQSELGEDFSGYSQLLLTEVEIEQAADRISKSLFDFDLNNLERFSQQISAITNRQTVNQIVSTLRDTRDLLNLLKTTGQRRIIGDLDQLKVARLLAEASNHAQLLVLRDSVESSQEASELLNSALEEIAFTFIKTGEEELKMGDEARDLVRRVREALSQALDERSPEFVAFFEEFRRIMIRGNIRGLSSEEMPVAVRELTSLLNQVTQMNLEDGRLSEKYLGDRKFARVHQSIRRELGKDLDEQLFPLLFGVKSTLDDILASNEHLIENRGYFEAAVLRAVALGPEIKHDGYDTAKLALLVAQEYWHEFERTAA